MNPTLSGRSTWILIGTGLLWVSCVATGFTLLQREEFTPVSRGPVASDFPAGTSLSLARDRPTLFVFLHPHCPCSRATMYELDELRATTKDRVAVSIVFTIPKDTPPDWEQGDLLNSAQTMTGVRVVRDEDGAAAQAFGAKGSGHALLYDPSGRLLFSGGITGSRGQEGDNPGQSAIADFVLHGHAKVTHTPVFGCSLL